MGFKEINKIKMLKTMKGSPNGIIIQIYKEGKEYEVNESLAKAFVKDLKVAEIIKEKNININKEEIKINEIKTNAIVEKTKIEKKNKRSSRK